MKKSIICALMVLLVIGFTTEQAFSWGKLSGFNKVIHKDHLSCMGIQYFPMTGNWELFYPNDRALASFEKLSKEEIMILMDRAADPKDCQIRRSHGGEALWLPVCGTVPACPKPRASNP